MRTIARNQVSKTIRNILADELAAKFINNRHYLMMVAIGQASEMVNNNLNAAFENDAAQIKKMLNIYQELDNTEAMFSERINSHKTVSGKKTLLTHLTDGMTHLKIYPNVDFN